MRLIIKRLLYFVGLIFLVMSLWAMIILLVLPGVISAPKKLLRWESISFLFLMLGSYLAKTFNKKRRLH
jgi:hypothetical protein